jgi:hypothetical protein
MESMTAVYSDIVLYQGINSDVSQLYKFGI